MMRLVALGALATASADVVVYQASADAGDASMNQMLEMDGIAFQVKDPSLAPAKPGTDYLPPWVFACGVFVGGPSEVKALHDSNELAKLASCDLGVAGPAAGSHVAEVQKAEVPQPAAAGTSRVLEPPPNFDAAFPHHVADPAISSMYGQQEAYPEQVHYGQVGYPEQEHYAQGAYPEQVHYAQGAYPEQVHYAQVGYPEQVHFPPASLPDVSFGGYAPPVPAAPEHAYQSWTAPTVGYPHVEYNPVQHLPAQYPHVSFPGYAPPAPAAPQQVYQPWAAPMGLAESYTVADSAPLFALYGEPQAFNIGSPTFTGHRTFVDVPPYR